MKENVSKRTRNPIFFRMGGGWKSVSINSIVYMEASASKCIFFMDDGTVKEVEMPLGTALAKTQEQTTTLLRVHRSYAVNIEHIDMVSAVRLRQHPTYHQHLLMEIPLTFLRILRDKIVPLHKF